jgi:hypothetical protein
VHTPDSRLLLPVRPPRDGDAELRAFAEPEGAPGVPTETLDPDPGARTLRRDFTSGETELTFHWDQGGRYRLPDSGIVTGYWATTVYSIVPGDPLSAQVRCRCATEFGREGLITRAEVDTVMTADAERFRIQTELAATEDGREVRRHTWDFETPRDLA